MKKPRRRKETKQQDSLSLRLLYHTVPGRFVLRGLIRPGVSAVAGKVLDSRLSARFVPGFIRRHHIDMTAYGEQQYASFNAFFTRRREESPAEETDGVLLSPCDGLLSVYPVGTDSLFHIKHVDYSLAQLLQSAEAAERYAGGNCLIFRLTPQHYHRYGYCCSGRPVQRRRIRGVLHTVRPLALTMRPVFHENSREYTVLETEEGGRIVQMEVGALLVGKICNHSMPAAVTAGEEKGYFAFGGSTIIVLLEKDSWHAEGALLRAAASAGSGEEISVRKGDCLARI